MARPLPLLGAPPAPPVPAPIALAAKGFRPFFLVAGTFAAGIVPLWLAIVFGVIPATGAFDPTMWHAHEMLLGFATAVIAGFLLTAVGNWTQRETLVGTPLLGLAALWVLGRVAMLGVLPLPAAAVAAIDLAFLPLLTIAVGRPILATRNRRNFVMIAVLAALFAANVTMHLDALGSVAPGLGLRAAKVALDVVVLVMLVMAARVVPMFTRNATNVATVRNVPALDLAVASAVVALAALDAGGAGTALVGPVSGLAAALTWARTIHWGTPHTLRHPLLWVLHVGHLWLGVGLAMRAASALGAPLSPHLATHALTVGALGCLTLGMMARVALGHTGRALRAPSAMSWAFAALACAALVRVLTPAVMPAWAAEALQVSAVLWTFAFGAFVATYASILTSPRPDGKAG